MTSRRSASSPDAAPSAPLANAALLVAAVTGAMWMLVSRGRVSWPPHHLLSSLYTVAGCLAIVGPVVVGRAGASEGGLGDLVWTTAGLLVWVYDAAALIRGRAASVSWVTPLETQAMGLTILAVMLAGWRCRVGSRSWSWTNVLGWILGLFWIGMAVASWIPVRIAGFGSR